MKMLGKIAPIVVILACVGSLFFAFKLKGIKTDLQGNLARTTTERDNTQKQLADTKSELAKATSDLKTAIDETAQAKADLTAAELARDKFKTDAETAQAKAAELQQAADEAQAKLAENEATLKKLQELTESDDFRNIEDIRKKIEVLTDENKVLSEQLAVITGEKAKLTEELKLARETPPGIRANVALVDERWNFVVLDVGKTSHVHTNTEFVVYRDNKLISKVNVVTVKENTCIGEILPEFAVGTPRPGDLAIHGRL